MSLARRIRIALVLPGPWPGPEPARPAPGRDRRLPDRGGPRREGHPGTRADAVRL